MNIQIEKVANGFIVRRNGPYNMQAMTALEVMGQSDSCVFKNQEELFKHLKEVFEPKQNFK